MRSFVMPAIVGAVLIVIGIMNIRGNISTLHSYHRIRVTSENARPFGRAVGTGTIICGASVILKTCFEFAAQKAANPTLDKAGSIVLGAGMVIGMFIIVKAMLKYNKGLF